MMTEELDKIVSRHEMQRLELKEGFNVESIEAACAFANAGWVEILDAHDFKGNIQDQVDETVTFIKRNKGRTRRDSVSNYMKIKIVLEGNYMRVVTVPSLITLDQVHDMIQALFDWGNCHLWEFEDGAGRIYASEDDEGFGWGDERKKFPVDDFCLCDVLPVRGAKLKYTYDFGDNWRHTITRMADPKEQVIKCVKATGPDGLEDVGGIWGIEESEEELHIPTPDELTDRLQALGLTPMPEKQGEIQRMQNALLQKIRALSRFDWEHLVELGETGLTTPMVVSKHFLALTEEFSTIRAFCFGYSNSFHADREFKKYWKENKDAWFAARR